MQIFNMYRIIPRRVIISLFCLFFAVGLALRVSILEFTYLNDDSAIIHGAKSTLLDGNAFSLFYTAYGPKVIRPFQLIGLGLEQLIFGEIEVSYIIGLILLAVIQVFFFLLLSKFCPPSVALGGSLLLATSPITSEPVLWLSDRHDLYLALFVFIAFLAVVKLSEPDKVSLPTKKSHWSIYLFSTLALIGSLYSNEKGVALCLIVPVAHFFLLLNKNPSKRVGQLLCSKKLIVHSALYGLTILGYFALRYFAIGELIGGYDNSVIPSDKRFLEIFFALIGASISIPFHGGSAGYWIYNLILSLPLFIILGGWVVFIISHPSGQRRKILMLLGSWAIYMLAFVPTLKYTLQGTLPQVGGTRFFWLPHIILTIVCTLLAGDLVRNKRQLRIPLMIAFLLQLSTQAFSVVLATNQMNAAHTITKSAVDKFMKVCSCMNPRDGQSYGLPVLYNGVNTFTEKVWLDYHALARGYGACGKDDVCEIEFMAGPAGELSYIPWQFRKPIVGNFSKDAFSALDTDFAVSHIESFGIHQDRKDKFIISGWIYETSSGQPVERIWIFIDSMLFITLEPNIYRELTIGTEAKYGAFGFFIPIPSSKIIGNSHTIDIYAGSVTAGRLLGTKIHSLVTQ